jgi:DNA repair protein RadC
MPTALRFTPRLPANALTVRDLPLDQRPRERLTQLGPEALSEHELLGCLLGRGIANESVLISARRLLAAFGTLPRLASASIEALSAVHGIGPAKAAQVKAALELARRLALPAASERPVIDSADAAAAHLRPRLMDKRKEHVVALLLDARHRLIRVSEIAVGSLSASLVHPRELFKEAVSASAAAVIVAHNHPSGDPEPSAHDLELTGRLVNAGAILGIEVLDHLIVGAEGVVSLAARGAVSGRSPSRRGARAGSQHRRRRD